jgi:phage repressor protein C with HTH and peptisase S24 domain
MASIVTKRFIECHNHLIERAKVRSSRQFVMELGYSPQSWSKVLKEERDVTVELIRKAIERFSFNPSYIFSGLGEPLLNKGHSQAPVLAVAVDEKDEERIIHVPVSAQAGYLDQFNDPVFIKELPSFSLPGFEFKHATYRAFDIAGDSMEPSIYQGEMVVCSYVDQDLWLHNIRNDYVYIIVTRGDVVIKRVRNQIRNNATLLLCSDNTFYDPYEVHVDDIREIWYVKMKISPFAHAKVTSRVNMEDKFDDMKSVIHSQSITIQNLNKTIERMLKKDRIVR